MATRYDDLDEIEPRIRDLLFRPVHSTKPFDVETYNYYMTRLDAKRKQISRLIEEIEEDIELLNHKRALHEENIRVQQQLEEEQREPKRKENE
jgi:hypothetical protein